MISYNPSQLTKGARAIFMQALGQETNVIDRIATRIPSDSASEDYAWMGEPPQMEEFLDEVKFAGMSDTLYSLVNKTYTSGIRILRKDLEDEKTGGIAMRIMQLAEVAGRHPNKLLTAALTEGTTNTGHDANAVFSATHPARGQQTATQSNLLTGTGVTTATVQADLNSAVAALAGFLAENNEPVNESFARLWIQAPPELRKPLKEAIQAGVVAQTTNVQLSDLSFDLMFNPRLSATSTVDWYMGIQDTVVRGLVFQDRVPLEFTPQDQADSDASFVREEYRYKTRYRSRAGYGLWYKMVKINN